MSDTDTDTDTMNQENEVDVQNQEQEQETHWEIAASPYWALLPTTLRPLMPNRTKNFRKKQPHNQLLLFPKRKSHTQDSSPDDSTITAKEEEEEEDTSDESGFSPFVAFCFTINYILGTGFLTIPWAFVQSGLVLSTCVLVVSAFISDMAKDYLLETMARAEAMLDDDMPMHWRPNTTIAITAAFAKKRPKPTNIQSPNSKMTSTITSTPYNNSHTKHQETASKTTKHSQHRRQRSCPKENTAFQLTDIESALQEKGRLLLDKMDDRKYSNNANTNTYTNATLNIATVGYYGSISSSPIYANNANNAVKSALPAFASASPLLVSSPLIAPQHPYPYFYNQLQSPRQERYLVRNRKFEVNTLCRVFIGKKGVAVFTLFISLYIVGLLWAYTSVFANAMAQALPLFPNTTSNNTGDTNTTLSAVDWNYVTYAILFGCVVVPLSCMELTEQVTIQVFMTACRFLMLFLMIGTTTFWNSHGEWSYLPNNDNSDGTFLEAPLVRFQGLYKTLPILVVANMYHHSIPGLSHCVADKRKLTSIFRFTSVFTSFAYSVIGVLLGAAFGMQIQQSVNLNWKQYRGNPVAALYIVLFPALDVLSAFPLNAITLGNNMFGAYFGARVHQVEQEQQHQSNNSSGTTINAPRIFFRILASLPPVIGGIFVRDLGTITDYTGTTGFVIGFSIPALLYLTSKNTAIRKHYSTKTYYTSYASWDPLARLVFWFGVAMVVLVLGSLLTL